MRTERQIHLPSNRMPLNQLIWSPNHTKLVNDVSDRSIASEFTLCYTDERLWEKYYVSHKNFVSGV